MNQFIEDYKVLRRNGLEDIKAFGLIAAHVAITGTLEDLQELYRYHQDDFMNECRKAFNELEELNYERDQVNQFKVS